ncbi:MAG: hypothetical protein PHV74_12450 [Dehalococcoidia bacterium]|nr:hypothetical protein [Dehalococcoidia bacterium]
MAVRDLVEEGDYLLVLHYTIDWDLAEDQPEDPANKTFLIRLMETDQSEVLGIASIYPFFDYGYGEGCAAMYFPADTAPEWNGAYVIRIETSPSYWATPSITTMTLTSNEYSPFEGQSENQTWLKAYIIDLGIELEFAWDAPGELITQSVGIVLAESGEMYFEGAITGLRTLCPSLFLTQVTVPGATPREWTQTKADEYKDQWDGTFVEDANDSLDDLFGSASMMWNLVGMGLMLGCMTVSSTRFQTARPGMLLGFVPIPILARLGLFSPAFMAVIVFMFVIYLGYNFFWKSAG